jgi:hypothetical protein
MLGLIEAFGRRRNGPAPAPFDPNAMRDIEKQAMQAAMEVRKFGDAEGRMWNKIWGAAVRKPQTMTIVGRIMLQYAQARHMFDIGDYWEPRLSMAPAPAPAPARREAATA